MCVPVQFAARRMMGKPLYFFKYTYCDDIAVFLVYFYFSSGPRVLMSLFYHC